jgi:hypothetical protein
LWPPKILGDHNNKQIAELLTKDPTNTTSEAELRTVAEGEVEAHTHRDLYTVCTMATKPTIAPKIAAFTLTPKQKWVKS